MDLGALKTTETTRANAYTLNRVQRPELTNADLGASAPLNSAPPVKPFLLRPLSIALALLLLLDLPAPLGLLLLGSPQKTEFKAR